MTQILVVDDDKAVLNLLREALPTLGFDADFADNGDEAIELIKQKPYDLIISDIRMPNMNGIEVATAAIRDSQYIPVLFMSGNPNVQVEEQSFLEKPFSIAELEAKISFMLQENDN